MDPNAAGIVLSSWLPPAVKIAIGRAKRTHEETQAV
jgi:hypothetical protein